MNGFELSNIAHRLAAEVETTYLSMLVRQLREHAHRFQGVDGEKALNEFANAIERVKGGAQ